jgi:GABA permease
VSEEPGESVRKATNSVISRVLVFYVLSVFLIVCILPWDSTELGKSPFTATLDEIGIPAAAQVMNVIVLTAVLSCLNSGLYVASRMNFALARRGDAPQWMVRLNGRGVPARAILIASSIGFLSVIANVISPDKVFLFLLNSSGAVALFVYLLICVSQLVMRRKLEREDPERLKVRMWLSVPDVVRDRGDRGRHRVDGVREGRALTAVPGPGQRRGRRGRLPDQERAWRCRRG